MHHWALNRQVFPLFENAQSLQWVIMPEIPHLPESSAHQTIVYMNTYFSFTDKTRVILSTTSTEMSPSIFRILVLRYVILHWKDG